MLGAFLRVLYVKNSLKLFNLSLPCFYQLYCFDLGFKEHLKKCPTEKIPGNFPNAKKPNFL